jgi:hypothetical protein
MGEETISTLLGKMDVISAQLEHLEEGLARHQEALAALSESVMSIKLERARERGYFMGAMAVGSLAGGLMVKLLGLSSRHRFVTVHSKSSDKPWKI